MDTFLQDVRYGLRMLVKSPGFTAIAVLTLALGIGANTAIFSIVNAVLLRPLPYRDSAGLVKVWNRADGFGLPKLWLSEPEWWELRDTNQAFSEIAAYTPLGGRNLTAGQQPVRVQSGFGTASLFPMLGVHPVLGRNFAEDDDQPGRKVVMISYGLWQSLFAGDRGVVGKTVQLDGATYSIVGVLPNGFEFAGKTDVWEPLGLDRAKPLGRGSHYLEVLGRLRPGVTVAQADSQMRGFAAQLAREYPKFYTADGKWSALVVPFHQELVGDVRPALLVLTGAVGFVLLIGCANLANLLLARASGREKEMAIRASLGAGKLRLIRQLLTESVLLALAGGVVGTLLAYWGVELLHRAGPADLPRLSEISVDARVLGFTLVLSVFTGILFGLAPAVHVAGSHLSESLKDSGRGTTGGRASQKLRGALVVSEVALALVLLVGAGLMVRSFQQILRVNPGFQTEHILTARISLPKERYKDGPPVTQFFSKLTDQLATLPGVKAVGAVDALPLSGQYSSGSTYVEHTSMQGFNTVPDTHIPYIEADQRNVTPGYFDTLRIPLLRGRVFTAADDENAPLVAIVDSDFARRFWPNEDPIGKHIAFDTVPNSKPAQYRWRTVVGLVGHIKHYALETEGREQVYFAESQVSNSRDMNLALRTVSDPAALAGAVRQQVASLDSELPIYEVKTMDQWLDSSTAQRRMNVVLLSVFAGLALVLASIGIYGVMAYSVTLRTHEIGIRVALGAKHADVLRLVFAQGLRLIVIGLTIGLVAGLGLSRLISSLLYGVSPTDAVTFIEISALLAGTAVLATYLPARRAMQVDPMVALRYE